MKKKSVSVNLIFNLIYQILTILLPLITTPYLSRVLGSEKIGIYGFTYSISTYFLLFASLGVTVYGQREIAKVQDKKKEYSKVFYEIVIIKSISVIISLIVYAISFCIMGEYVLYYRIFSIYILSTLFDINWLFQGLEDFSKTVIRNIVVKLLSIILIFTLVKTQNDLWIYILIFVLTEVIGNLSIWLYLPRYIDKISLSKLNLKRHIKPVFILFLPQVASQIYTVLDKTMVGIITNDMNEVGYYEQAQKIARAALVIVAAMQTVLNSRVANAFHKKNIKEVKQNLKNGFNYVWFIGVPLTFGIAAVASNLVPWYYGDGFDSVSNILIAISPMIIIIGLSGITGYVYLVQTDQSSVFTKSIIFGAITNVICNVILIKKFGAVGAAIASVIAETSILIYHLFYIKCNYKVSDIFKDSIKCLFSGIIMFVIVYYISCNLKSSIFNTCLLTLIGGLIYITILYITRYDYLMDIIKKIINKLKGRTRYEKK